MGTKTLASILAVLLLLGAGCIGIPEKGGTSTPTVNPGYGEFNAGNVLIGDGGAMGNHYGLVVSQNRSVVLRGLVFARGYRVSSTDGNTTGYYRGRARLKAYLADTVVFYAWSGLEPKLKPVSRLEVEITPETIDVEPGKNATFEVIINPSDAVLGRTYYLYIVAFGENGWKGWALVEIKVGNTINLDSS